MPGKEYPNNWDAYVDAPEELFDGISWEEFNLWKLNYWELNASHTCVIRAECRNTGRIKEHTYKQIHAARKRLHSYLNNGNYTVTICTNESIQQLSPKETDIFDTDTD